MQETTSWPREKNDESASQGVEFRCDSTENTHELRVVNQEWAELKKIKRPLGENDEVSFDESERDSNQKEPRRHKIGMNWM